MGPLVVMVTSLGLMANVLCDIAALKIPIEWNEKGKPTKYRQMNEQDFKNAATNAGFIIGISSYKTPSGKYKLFSFKKSKQKILFHEVESQINSGCSFKLVFSKSPK